ncbi:MAG TPA: PTS glucose transporter subunit IIA [Actinocrinis sp.]|jgi:glucose-specific phosphotransferase system IIA component
MNAKNLIVYSPMAGTAIALRTVPDPVFADAMVGPGAAVDPRRGAGDGLVTVSPIAGTLVKLKPHAFVVVDEGGRGVLVHLGIDTVNLDGTGFDLLTAEGAELKAGEPVVRWSPDDVARQGMSPICPVIALDAAPAAVGRCATGPVQAGGELFHWFAPTARSRGAAD